MKRNVRVKKNMKGREEKERTQEMKMKERKEGGEEENIREIMMG